MYRPMMLPSSGQHGRPRPRWRQQAAIGLLAGGILTDTPPCCAFISSVPTSSHARPRHPRQHYSSRKLSRSSSPLVANQRRKNETCSFLRARLGPPPQLVDVPMGEYRRFQRSDQRNYDIERISDEPHAFVLRNFLNVKECNEIMKRADDQGMGVAETKEEEGSSSRQKCGVAWLSSFPLEKELIKSIRSVLIQEEVVSSSDLFVELLQVLKYSEGGLYEIHHDGEPRFLTVIYYLNGIGATWFPFATIGDWDPCDDIPTISDVNDLRDRFTRIRRGEEGASMDVGDTLQPGIHGVIVASRSMLDEEDIAQSEGRIVPIDKGDALAFYNFEYDDEEKGIPRESFRALHMGMPADDGKYIANHWFRLDSTTNT